MKVKDDTYVVFQLQLTLIQEKMHQYFISIYFLLCVIVCATELPEWHMKPLGTHIKPDSVDETFADKLISPEEFAKNYVIPRKPLVLRDVVKSWPAYSLWTDEYLSENYGDMEMRLEGKKEKGSRIPKGDVCLGRDHLRTFLDDYKRGADKYVVSDLPTPMWGDVHVPPCMACGEFLNNFVEIDVWINSDLGKKGKGGNSVLHKDAFNTVNCVLNGTKEWKLIDLKYNDYVYQSWEGPMDAGYGGFSIINPEKVDATSFPDVGRIPHWQFTTINAGDCIYLPSQMWHQVKSYGHSNKAVAFLFSQFNDRTDIDTQNCSSPAKTSLPLSDVDVDLQYPGTGLMTMGHSQISDIHEDLIDIVNTTTGYITKRSTYKMIYINHRNGAKNRQVLVEKAKQMYHYFLDLAGGDKTKMTVEFIENLTRAQIRPLYKWLFPIEPANSYDHEYSFFQPEHLEDMLSEIKGKNNGVITKKMFYEEYENAGGTKKFAQEFWERLAGTQDELVDISGTLEHALERYEHHRRNDPDLENADEEAVIVTPQGHKSQPKKMRGGYAHAKEENGNEKTEKENGKIEL